jgi:outer membrane protein assembly factor BamD
LARATSILLSARFVAVAACVAALASCSPIPEFSDVTVEDAYSIGVAALEREDYLTAIEAFTYVTTASPLSDWADDSLIGLADVHRAISEYAMAEDEYRQVVSDYPRSPLVPEAEYKLGLTYHEQSLPAELDQAMTLAAIDQFQYFTETYPQSEFVPEARAKLAELRARLAEKAYGAARLYQDLGEAAAARVYFEAVVADYPETDWARRSLLAIARSHVAEGATAEASEAYDRLIELYPGTEEAATARAERPGSAP